MQNRNMLQLARNRPNSVSRMRSKAPVSQQKEIQNLKRAVKKIQSEEELKHKDTQSSVSPATAGTFTLLNDIAVGDASNNRDGNDITSTSVQWRIRILSDVDALSGFLLRHIVFWDAQANGVAPTLAELLDLSVATVATIAPYNRDTQKRFKILHDSTIDVNPDFSTAFTVATGVTTAVASKRLHEIGRAQTSRIVKYDGTTAAIADIVTNSLYSVWISDANVEVPICQSAYRFYFKG